MNIKKVMGVDISTRTEFSLAQSQALQAWQELESRLFWIYAGIDLSTHILKEKASEYESKRFFKNRLAFITETIMNLTDNKKLLSDWHNFEEKLLFLATERNKMIHWLTASLRTPNGEHIMCQKPPYSDNYSKELSFDGVISEELAKTVLTLKNLRRMTKEFFVMSKTLEQFTGLGLNSPETMDNKWREKQ
jgi:hypothetical protein